LSAPSGGPTTIFNFDPTTHTYANVTPAGYDLTMRPNIMRMLMLPSGQVLFTNSSDQHRKVAHAHTGQKSCACR
jgi:hypothetical protein